jgi:UDP-N-acetylglucosamine--N-acetylmuramyl-(pentapeptide) pyrophosphoryl-undecaprenol N-acetylglucosamine transferase
MAVLLVASTGGHLFELVRIAPRLDLDTDDALWVTFDTPQSRSMLQGRRVCYVRPVASRDALGVLCNLPAAHRILGSEPWRAVVSTGAAIAMSYFVLAHSRGIPLHYIESAARTAGPSLTGRMAAAIPGAHLYTQYEAWADRRWLHRGSVFDSFSSRATAAPRPVRRVLVTLGTSPYAFERLVARLEAILPRDVEVDWQLGAWHRNTARGKSLGVIGMSELARLHQQADVVIAHAGVGSALTALGEGRAPILIPRLSRYRECVDDHQLAIAQHLQARGLAIGVDAGRLEMSHLERAASMSVECCSTALPFRLVTAVREQPLPDQAATVRSRGSSSTSRGRLP